MSLKDLIIYTCYILLLINFIVFFKSYPKKSIAFKIITVYLFFSLVIQLISEYIASYKGNNLFLFHYFNAFQFILLSFFYYSLTKNKLLKKQTAEIESQNIVYETYFPLFVVLLEFPAIVVGFMLAKDKNSNVSMSEWGKEIISNQSMVLMFGGLIIGLIAGEQSVKVMPLFSDLFYGVLALFLLEMGIVAAERIKDLKQKAQQKVQKLEDKVKQNILKILSQKNILNINGFSSLYQIQNDK